MPRNVSSSPPIGGLRTGLSGASSATFLAARECLAGAGRFAETTSVEPRSISAGARGGPADGGQGSRSTRGRGERRVGGAHCGQAPPDPRAAGPGGRPGGDGAHADRGVVADGAAAQRADHPADLHPPVKADDRRRAGRQRVRGRIEAIRLEESRLGVLELCIDADLRLGRHYTLLSELAKLNASFPMHENLCAQFMVALYRSGQQWRAIEAFKRLRDTLVDELGLEPSARLQHLQRAILRSDPALNEAPLKELLRERLAAI